MSDGSLRVVSSYKVGIPCASPKCNALLSDPIFSLKGRCRHAFHRSCLDTRPENLRCPKCDLLFTEIYRDEELENVVKRIDILGRDCLGEHSTEPLEFRIFKRAVNDGTLSVVDYMLKNKMVSPSLLINGLSPLFIACKKGDRDLASLLLAHGAGPSQRNDLSYRGKVMYDYEDEHGATPIQIAAKEGQGDLVELLIECGASLEELDKLDRTPLFNAIWAGEEDLALGLIAKGAAIDVKDGRQISLIAMAVRRGLLRVVEQLVMRGVFVEGTCIIDAAFKDNPEMLDFLLKNGGKEVINHKWLSHTPVSIAAQAGLLRNVQLLVEAGADLGGNLLEAVEKSLQKDIVRVQSADDREELERSIRNKIAVLEYLRLKTVKSKL